MLPNKWQRAAIGAAGIYVEISLASLATFIWWFTEPGILHYLCLNIMFISSVSTILFNANPLLRYDGYYILSDMISVPNLRGQATCAAAAYASSSSDCSCLPRDSPWGWSPWPCDSISTETTTSCVLSFSPRRCCKAAWF